MSDLLKALQTDFSGEFEILRQRLLNKTPKYGEDEDFADLLAKDLVDEIVDLVESHNPSPGQKKPKKTRLFSTYNGSCLLRTGNWSDS